VSRAGLRELTFALADVVEQHRVATIDDAPAERIVIRPQGSEKDFTIKVEGGTYGPVYRILGDKPVKWVQQTDFQNEEAVGYLADRLARLGVEDELFRAGAVAGATVVIGAGDGIVFDWEPTLSSAAELMTAPRGTDPRLVQNSRRTTSERRERYHERMDAKADARAELEAERLAARASDEEDER
jgi:GTP-binding protein